VYKDKEKQREADKERKRRQRGKGVTLATKGVTELRFSKSKQANGRLSGGLGK